MKLFRDGGKMKSGLLRVVMAVISVVTLVLPGYAGQLDDYYLTAFHEQPGSAVEKAVLLPSTETAVLRSGTALKHSLKQDWKKLESSTQTLLAKQLALPTLKGTATSLITPAGHFMIHYVTSGSDTPDIPDITSINQYTGLGLASVDDWAGKVGEAFEVAYSYYSTAGYALPPSYPDQYFHVYLKSLVATKPGENTNYGVTANYSQDDVYHNGQIIQPFIYGRYPNSSPAYITLDKDFTNSIFKPGAYNPLQSLQITSAHEFHHAIQYGYNYYFDIWYAEATSTWFEDEVYDNVNQNYSYIAAWLRGSTRQLDLKVDPSALSTGAGYGRWIFNRYLAERHTATVVRSFWEQLANLSPANNPVNSGGDIQMIPVMDSVLSSSSYNSSLGAEFFGFAKRVYTRNWQSHTGELSLIPTYSPVASYSSYPVNSSSTAVPSVTLPRYSFAYYTFTPSATTTNLTISLVRNSGVQATVYKKSGGVITEVTANSGVDSYTVNGFGGLNPATDEVALLLANTTSTDALQASFSTDGTTPAVTSSTGGGGGGCFIATAAYGSYLHPEVQLLRDFRDHSLLTNGPGRAFVAFYYRYSPEMADFIARHDSLRLLARLLLTPLVFLIAYPVIVSAMLMMGVSGVMVMKRRQRILR